MIITASSQASADKAVAKLKGGIAPDLSSLESVRAAFREAIEKFGCVGILVNNAGISARTPFTEFTEEEFDKVMDLNVKGVFNAARVGQARRALLILR